jgi:hypothetical protein
MNGIIQNPFGFIAKLELAIRLGVCVKTVNRRLKTEPTLARATMRAGRKVWINEMHANAYYELCKKRGYV